MELFFQHNKTDNRLYRIASLRSARFALAIGALSLFGYSIYSSFGEAFTMSPFYIFLAVILLLLFFQPAQIKPLSEKSGDTDSELLPYLSKKYKYKDTEFRKYQFIFHFMLVLCILWWASSSITLILFFIAAEIVLRVILILFFFLSLRFRLLHPRKL